MVVGCKNNMSLKETVKTLLTRQRKLLSLSSRQLKELYEEKNSDIICTFLGRSISSKAQFVHMEQIGPWIPVAMW
jgi:hypothetical protein